MEEIVKLVNRCNKPLEFMHDSIPYVLKAKETMMLPKSIALHAVSKAPVIIDASTGRIQESMFGIICFTPDGSIGKELYPITPLDLDPEVVAEQPKLNNQVVPGDPNLKKKIINLAPLDRVFT